jgi:hypothetical protein
MRSAAVTGVRYGVSCLGCSAALMVAIILIGMSKRAGAHGERHAAMPQLDGTAIPDRRFGVDAERGGR